MHVRVSARLGFASHSAQCGVVRPLPVLLRQTAQAACCRQWFLGPHSVVVTSCYAVQPFGLWMRLHFAQLASWCWWLLGGVIRLGLAFGLSDVCSCITVLVAF